MATRNRIRNVKFQALTQALKALKAFKRSTLAQYFTLDAFIAAMIVIVALVIVLAAHQTQPVTSQSELISKGLAESLANSKLRDLNNPLVINMSKNGSITNLDNTVLQQATEFYIIDASDKGHHRSFELLKNVTHGLIPPQHSFEVLINNELIYNRTLTNENTSSVIVSSKKLIFGVVNKTVLVYGPTVVEVRVWQ